MKIHKNDTVQIMVGKDSGKQGKVLKVFPKDNRLIIQGLNLFKKHKKPSKQGEKGEVVTIPKPIQSANVMIVCNNCQKPVRVGYRQDGEIKSRYCKKCKSPINTKI